MGGTEQLAKIRSSTALSSSQNSDRDLAMVEAGGIMFVNNNWRDWPSVGTGHSCRRDGPSVGTAHSCSNRPKHGIINFDLTILEAQLRELEQLACTLLHPTYLTNPAWLRGEL